MWRKLLGILTLFSFLPYFSICQNKLRENGWYHILSGQTDSISREPIVTTKDFIALKLDTDYFGKYVISGQISNYKRKKWAEETGKATGRQIAFIFNDSVITNFAMPPEHRDSIRMAIDYWEAYTWIKLTTKPDEHYWYSITDSAEYKKLEEALKEELEKSNLSSRASDYMQSDTYQMYKMYVCNNPEYINLMFQCFLFKKIRGLYSYLIDDIIQTKYPSAPSIRTYIDKTDNSDDERFAVYEWQRQIWVLMNKDKQTDDPRDI